MSPTKAQSLPQLEQFKFQSIKHNIHSTSDWLEKLKTTNRTISYIVSIYNDIIYPKHFKNFCVN